jgi:broad specificity phosphatase PhoE
MNYLIRHAEKLDGSVHAKLTPKGLKDSLLYGQNLKFKNIPISKIISSPIERCMQTAEQISIGYGGIKIEKSKLLGDPGIFVDNGDEAMEIFNRYSLVEIINMQLEKKELNGFNKIEGATQKLMKFMQNQKANTLYISHDAIITPFICFVNNINNIKENDIVDYLDGYKINSIGFSVLKI